MTRRDCLRDRFRVLPIARWKVVNFLVIHLYLQVGAGSLYQLIQPLALLTQSFVVKLTTIARPIFISTDPATRFIDPSFVVTIKGPALRLSSGHLFVDPVSTALEDGTRRAQTQATRERGRTAASTSTKLCAKLLANSLANLVTNSIANSIYRQI